MPKKRRSEAGLSLIEVLLVVLLLGIIATAVVPMMSSYSARAREARAEANDAVQAQAVERYSAEHKVGLGLVYDAAIDGILPYGIETMQGPMAQLLLPTDVNGNVMGDPATTNPGPFSYGPYLAQLPPEPASLVLAAAAAEEIRPFAGPGEIVLIASMNTDAQGNDQLVHYPFIPWPAYTAWEKYRFTHQPDSDTSMLKSHLRPITMNGKPGTAPSLADLVADVDERLRTQPLGKRHESLRQLVDLEQSRSADPRRTQQVDDQIGRLRIRFMYLPPLEDGPFAGDREAAPEALFFASFQSASGRMRRYCHPQGDKPWGYRIMSGDEFLRLVPCMFVR